MPTDARAVSGRAMALLAICAITVVYGSLFDWHFRVPSERAWALFWNPIHVRSELALNVLLYFPIGYLALAAFGRPGRAALAGLVLSACVEAIQPFFGRESRALDIAANAAGGVFGMIVADAARWWRGRVVLPPRPVAAIVPWVLYQTYPFARRLSSPVIWRLPGPDTLAGAGTGVVEWIAFLALAAAALPRWPHIAILLAALAGPAKPFFSGRWMTTGEWVAWAVALAIGLAFARRILARPAICGVALAVALAMGELAPYRLAAEPAGFNWTPFRALLSTDWASGTLIAAHKAFGYGALVYLLGAPSRFGRATMGVAAALCGLEWLQRWLPGRTPDITDPVIAAMLGASIWLLPEARRGANTLK